MGKVLVTADWHITKGGCNWPRRPEITGDTPYGMTQIVNIAREQNVEHIILAGDVFDKRLQYADALCQLRWFLDEIRRSDIRLYYVQGQHELSEPPLIAALADEAAAVHMDDYQVVINDKRVRGLDYQHPLRVRKALESLEECDVLVTHQVWKDFLSDDFGDAWFSDIGGEPEIVITGDFHETIIRKYGNMRIISPGSISLQRINEIAAKYVVVFDENWAETVIPLKSRGVLGIATISAAGIDGLVADAEGNPDMQGQQDVPMPLAKNILQLSVPSDVPDIEQRIAPLAEYVHVFLKVSHPELNPSPIGSAARIQAVEAGLEGCLEAFYQHGDHADFYRDALQLLRSSDLPADIHTIFEGRTADGDAEN